MAVPAQERSAGVTATSRLVTGGARGNGRPAARRAPVGAKAEAASPVT